MKKTYAYSLDSKKWTGSYGTRQKALEDAKKRLKGPFPKKIVVFTSEVSDNELVDVDDLIDAIKKRIFDITGHHSCISITDKQRKNLNRLLVIALGKAGVDLPKVGELANIKAHTIQWE